MKFSFGILLFFCSLHSLAQKNEQSLNLKDTLDGALDVSEFLIHTNGFIPVAQPITEPALGGLGVAIAPVFIHPNKYQTPGKYTPPNITAGIGAYTVNETWLVGAIRMASLPKQGLKYRIGGAYGSVNLDFYRNIPIEGEQKFSFNFKTIPVFGVLLKELGHSNIYAGLTFMYLQTDMTPQFDFEKLPDFIDKKSFKSTQSGPGLMIEFDRRDNVFTPNKGLYVKTNVRFYQEWTGSDFEFQNIDITFLKYFKFSPKWVTGLRLESQRQLGNAPFYLEPGINMRGVPRARYQGTSTYLMELEPRFDFTTRWSGVAIGGMAFTERSSYQIQLKDAIYNYGLGFRYLVARLFKLRMGVDVAASNEDWGYYLVFGSAW